MIRTVRLALLGGALTALVAGALYGTGSLRGNRAASGCAASAETAARLAPLARGEVAAFDSSRPAVPVPGLAFLAGDGAARTLAGYAGRTVLLNLWATWCEPCKREMPALDRVQRDLGGPGFEVVAVNIDTRNLERPRLWLEQAGIRHLEPYRDPEAKVFQVLRGAGEAEGLPTTLLIGPDGCRIGRLAGWAEWASPEGFALLRAALPPRTSSR